MALFIDVRLFARFLAAEVERASPTVAPVPDHVALGGLAAMVHQPGEVVSFNPFHAAREAVKEVERQINTGQRGIGGFHDGSEPIIKAGKGEGAGRAVEIAVNGFALGLLPWAVTRCEIADPSAFLAVAHDGPAEAVEVVPLAHFGKDREIRAEGFAGLFSEGFPMLPDGNHGENLKVVQA